MRQNASRACANCRDTAAWIRTAGAALGNILGFREAMQQVPFKVSFSCYPDETSEECDLILPDHHALESWGDAQAVPNVVSLHTCS